MELSQLHYFVTVAQMEHLTRAAESLHISQPALSKAISRLEEELGTTLFDRSFNRICLNRNGWLYLRYVQSALEALQTGQEALDAMADSESGNISIFTSCSGLLQPAIQSFLDLQQNLHYRQVRYANQQIAAHLEQGKSDFAVCIDPPLSGQFRWTELCTDELYALLPPEHPLSRHSCFTLRELAELPLILDSSLLSVHDILSVAFDHCGLTPSVSYELENTALTQQLVAEGKGVTFFPGLGRSILPKTDGIPWHLIPVENHALSYTLGILRLRNRFCTPASERLEQFLISWFRSQNTPSNNVPQ